MNCCSDREESGHGQRGELRLVEGLEQHRRSSELLCAIDDDFLILVQGCRVRTWRCHSGLDELKQDLSDLPGFSDRSHDADGGTTVAADEGIGLVDLGDQPCPGST
jgi:hypothetical protein